MFGLFKKKRVVELNERLGNILFVLSGSDNSACMRTCDGIHAGMEGADEEIKKLEQQGLSLDPFLQSKLAQSLENAAISAHHSGNSDFAKGLMLTAMLFESELLSGDGARALNLRIVQIIEGAMKDYYSNKATNPRASTKPLRSTPRVPTYSTYPAWYAAYCQAAENARPGIGGVINYIDQQPLRRAFADRIDPITLGRHFGENFDIAKFG